MVPETGQGRKLEIVLFFWLTEVAGSGVGFVTVIRVCAGHTMD